MARRTVRDTLFPVKLPVIGAALGRVEAPLAIPMDPALPEPFVVSPASVQYSAWPAITGSTGRRHVCLGQAGCL